MLCKSIGKLLLPSATWRAIIAGSEALKGGLIRRIGDGMTTEVWHDNWIQGTPSLRPVCRLSDDYVHLVADLLDEVGEWNEELVSKLFIAHDVCAILNMSRPKTMTFGPGVLKGRVDLLFVQHTEYLWTEMVLHRTGPC